MKPRYTFDWNEMKSKASLTFVTFSIHTIYFRRNSIWNVWLVNYLSFWFGLLLSSSHHGYIFVCVSFIKHAIWHKLSVFPCIHFDSNYIFKPSTLVIWTSIVVAVVVSFSFGYFVCYAYLLNIIYKCDLLLFRTTESER